MVMFMSSISLVHAQSSVPSIDNFKKIVESSWPVWTRIPKINPQTKIPVLTLINDLADNSMAPSTAQAAALASIAYYYSLVLPNQDAGGKINRDVKLSLNDVLNQTCDYIYYPNYEIWTNYGSFCTMYSALMNLTANNYPLYTKGQPLFSDIQQNKIGDCYFMSAIGWLTLNSPGTIPGMISQTYSAATPAVYNVRLTTGMQRVQLTPAEIVFFSKSSTVSDGIWEPVLQKAVAQAIAASDTSTQPIDKIEPLWNLETTIPKAGTIQQMLCGGKSYWYDHTYDETSWGQALQQALSNNKIIQALSGAAVDGVVGDHWHAIIGFDNTTNKYIMWNPWGDTTTHNYPRIGTETSDFPRVDGKFEMTLAELYSHFKGLVTPANRLQ